MLKLFIKRMFASASDFWICSRCGTTNLKGSMYCKQCKNRRPY